MLSFCRSTLIPIFVFCKGSIWKFPVVGITILPVLAFEPKKDLPFLATALIFLQIVYGVVLPCGIYGTSSLSRSFS